ncbi:MAG: hypothetical protein GWN58_59725, partial [Anaerolineae bacterium]|nr:hypothetical protein [Anaerolineae bacterium]
LGRWESPWRAASSASCRPRRRSWLPGRVASNLRAGPSTG